MLRKVITALCMASVVAMPTTVFSKDPNEAAIKARRGYMQLVLFNAGPLFGMAKVKVEYNAELANQLAKNLGALTTMDSKRMWPKGSDNTAYKGKTRATPGAWTDQAAWDASKAYDEAVAGLVANAGNGLDALRAGVGALGKSCKGCHDAGRAKDF